MEYIKPCKKPGAVLKVSTGLFACPVHFLQVRLRLWMNAYADFTGRVSTLHE